MTRTRLAARIAFAAALLCLPQLAAAQSAPLPSVASTHDGYLLRADALSTTTNPAQLTFLRGSHFVASTRYIPDAPNNQLSFGGHAAYGFGKALSIGAGVDRLSDLGTAFSLGLGLGGKHAAFGFSTTRWHAPDEPGLRGLNVARLGWSFRLGNVAGMGFVVDNVFAPERAGVETPRRLIPALSLRAPDGTVESEIRYAATVGDADGGRLGATVRVRPTPGVRVFGQLDFHPRHFDTTRTATVGLELSTGHVTAGAGALLVPDDVGFVAALEMSSTPTPGFRPRTELVRIDLAGDPDEGTRFQLRGQPTTFTDVLLALDEVRRDDRLDGVFLNMGGLTAGTAQLYELRSAIRALQAADKTVIAYFDRASVRDLYVAGSADIRLASPTLSILTTGLGITRTYFATLFERVGIEAEFVRIGEYKSGPERFTHEGPTPQAEEQVGAYLDEVWTEISRGLAENYALAPDAVDGWVRAAPLLGEQLVADGRVDALVYRDQLPADLEERLGGRVSIITDPSPQRRDEYWTAPNPIAVLHIDGAIVSGQSGHSLFGVRAGAETIEAACRELAESPHIRGVIVRIDSPGGSALASDRIHRALGRLAAEVPVVVSMGDVAASGGMYVAAFGEQIFASPTTLTGSIGIYAGTASVDGLLTRVGINRVRDDRGGPHDLFDGRAWSEDDRRAVEAHIGAMYETFLTRVAEGREMTTEEVDAVAQGRIWSGAAAAGHGLIDHTTGFLGAVEAIRAEAGLRDGAPVSLVHYPRPRANLFALLPSMPDVSVAVREEGTALVQALGLSAVFEELSALVTEPPGAAMARLEWRMEGL